VARWPAAAFGTAAVLTAGGALIVVLPVLLIAVLPEIRRQAHLPCPSRRSRPEFDGSLPSSPR